MGNLKFGTNTPLALYMGASGATKAYYGTTEVFPGGTPIDYSKEYLTFEVLTGGTICWHLNSGTASKSKTISYSKNGGEWTALASTTGDGISFNVDAGDVVRFKGDTAGTGDGVNDSGNYSSFKKSTAYFNVYGNLLSIANSTGYTSGATLTNSFKSLFTTTNVVSAEHLIIPSALTVAFEVRSLFNGCTSLTMAPELPATSLTMACYNSMFSGCTSLYVAPILPALSVPAYAYYTMFDGCSSLNYIKCLATDIKSDATSSWVRRVSSTGTFTKDPNMSSWKTGVDGIPNGWTVIDAT